MQRSYEKKSFADTVETFRYVVQRLQKYSGVSSDILLRSVGRNIGLHLARKMARTESKALVCELAELWDRLNIGEIRIEQETPLEFAIRGCTGCELKPDAGGPCGHPFQEEIFRTVLSEKLSKPVTVELVETVGSHRGNKQCRFRVDIPASALSS